MDQQVHHWLQEGADEDAKTKLIPKTSKLKGKHSVGGLGPLVQAILVSALALMA